MQCRAFRWVHPTVQRIELRLLREIECRSFRASQAVPLGQASRQPIRSGSCRDRTAFAANRASAPNRLASDRAVETTSVHTVKPLGARLATQRGSSIRSAARYQSASGIESINWRVYCRAHFICCKIRSRPLSNSSRVSSRLGVVVKFSIVDFCDVIVRLVEVRLTWL